MASLRCLESSAAKWRRAYGRRRRSRSRSTRRRPRRRRSPSCSGSTRPRSRNSASFCARCRRRRRNVEPKVSAERGAVSCGRAPLFFIYFALSLSLASRCSFALALTTTTALCHRSCGDPHALPQPSVPAQHAPSVPSARGAHWPGGGSD